MRCDFGSPPGINVEDTSETDNTAERFGYRLVNTGTSLITASLAIFVEDVSLLYVAHSGVIGVYVVPSASLSSETGDLVLTIDDLPSVKDIGWEEGSSNITITTDDQA
jgi:hypothetical protein